MQLVEPQAGSPEGAWHPARCDCNSIPWVALCGQDSIGVLRK